MVSKNSLYYSSKGETPAIKNRHPDTVGKTGYRKSIYSPSCNVQTMMYLPAPVVPSWKYNAPT